MLSSRVIKIIYILWSEERVFSSKELSSLLHVSIRTIKYDIQQVDAVLDEYGMKLSIHKGKGYELHIMDEELFKKLYYNELSRYADYREIPDEFKRRVQRIMRNLLTHDFVTMEELAGTFYMDARSLSKEMREVRHQFSHYHLEVITRPHYGLMIKGKELHKRMCIVDSFLYYSHRVQPIYPDKEYHVLFAMDSEKRLEIRSCFLELAKEYVLHIKDIHSQKFIYQLILSYNRMTQGYPVHIDEDEAIKILQFREYKVVTELCDEVEYLLQTQFTFHEKVYLTLILLSYLDIVPQIDLSSYGYLYSEAVRLRDDIIKGFKEKYKLKLPANKAYSQALLCACFPIAVKVRYYLYEHNEWFTQWRYDSINDHFVALELSYFVSQILSKKSGFMISKEDIQQLAYTFMNELHKSFFPYKKRKIIMFPVSGYASIELVRHKLLTNFEEFIECVDIVERYLIRDKKLLEQYDYLIVNEGYGDEFKQDINILSAEDVLSLNTNHCYNNLVMSGVDFSPYLAEISKDSFLELDEAETMDEIIDLISSKLGYSMDKNVYLKEKFRIQNELVFNLKLRETACFLDIHGKVSNDTILFIHLNKPLICEKKTISDLIYYSSDLYKGWIHGRTIELILNELVSEPRYLEKARLDQNNSVYKIIKLHSYGGFSMEY